MPEVLSVPSGKKVRFLGLGIDDQEFLLEEDVNIKISSNFGPLIDASVSETMTVGASVLQALTKYKAPVSSKYLGFEIWKGSEPLGFSFTVQMHMLEDAWKDVVYPSQLLLSMPLPSMANDTQLGPATIGVGSTFGGLTAPGPDIVSFLEGSNKGMIGIQLGPCRFDKCIVVGCDVTYSTETTFVDITHPHSYPIWAKVRVDAKTIFTGNTSMIWNMMH
jgi:hypothetical protein